MKKSIFVSIWIIILFTLAFWYLVAGSFYDISTDQQKPFTTDKCTLIPEGTWEQCCVEHDDDYWMGGSSNERKVVDRKFRACVQGSSNNKILPLLMYSVVRISGTPFIRTPWRWGYGWEFGRGYR
jgi:hypothetical protein